MMRRIVDGFNILLILYLGMQLISSPSLLLGGVAASFLLLYVMIQQPDLKRSEVFIHGVTPVLQYSMLGISIITLLILYSDIVNRIPLFLSEEVVLDYLNTTYGALYAFAGSLYIALTVGKAAGSIDNNQLM